MVDGEQFYGDRSTKIDRSSRIAKKKLEKLKKEHKGRQKAADSMLKQESHSHHQMETCQVSPLLRACNAVVLPKMNP